MKYKIKRKKKIKIIIKLFVIFIIPLILTIKVSTTKHTTCEFFDENSKRMVIPAAPHPYLSQLFSDVFLSLGMNCYRFCVQNNCYSKEHSLPFDLKVRLEGMRNFVTIHYGQTKCFPVYKKDIFYYVVPGQFVIPNKEWVENHFQFDGEKASIGFEIEELMNFNVYQKLSTSAILTIYMLFVAAIFGFLQLLICIYAFIFEKKKDKNIITTNTSSRPG